jgi:hypothetical protein
MMLPATMMTAKHSNHESKEKFRKA